jgi:UDPglucose 6-dehydrogenase
MRKASMQVRIAILGAGYLGATHAACLADLGFEVLGLDINETQIKALQRLKGQRLSPSW